jgi:membrane protein DedA with SNARE-associated domain
MDAWDVLGGLAWVIAIGLLGWMARDAWRVSRSYDEDFLLSSREGDE